MKTIEEKKIAVKDEELFNDGSDEETEAQVEFYSLQKYLECLFSKFF